MENSFSDSDRRSDLASSGQKDINFISIFGNHDREENSMVTYESTW